MSFPPRPSADEYAPHYARYLEYLPRDGDVERILAAQLDALPKELAEAGEGRAACRYADGKWSVREVIGHLVDAERVFSYRLLRIARGDETPLPGFDENDYVRAADFERRWPTSWPSGPRRGGRRSRSFTGCRRRCGSGAARRTARRSRRGRCSTSSRASTT